MKRVLEDQEVSAILIGLLAGARHSVDLACCPHLPFAGQATTPALRVILATPTCPELRSLFGMKQDGEYVVHESTWRQLLKDPETSVAPALRPWRAFAMGDWSGSHYVLVDRRMAFVATMPILTPRWDVYLTDDPDELRERAELFERAVSYSWRIRTTPLHLEFGGGAGIRTWQELVEVSGIDWDRVLHALAEAPSLVHSMPPRTFEELIAELLAREGLAVHLTPPTRDGGRDILAINNTRSGSFLYLVECKRYAPDHPVGVNVVRSLFGMVELERATAGMLFTTSRFTRGAIAFGDSVKHRLSLHDYWNLADWLTAPGHLGSGST